MKTFVVAAWLCAALAAPALAQISIGGGTGPQTFRVQGTMGLGNGESCVTIGNPNTTGNFLFLFPQMAQLKPGEVLPLQLCAVGQQDHTALVWRQDPNSQRQDPVVAGGEKSSSAQVTYASVKVDIPAMLSGTSQIVRLDIPGVKAGAAVTVSPAEELPGMLCLAHASAPIDCVVIIKFINPGPFVPGMTMQMSVGAIYTATP